MNNCSPATVHPRPPAPARRRRRSSSGRRSCRRSRRTPPPAPPWPAARPPTPRHRPCRRRVRCRRSLRCAPRGAGGAPPRAPRAAGLPPVRGSGSSFALAAASLPATGRLWAGLSLHTAATRSENGAMSMLTSVAVAAGPSGHRSSAWNVARSPAASQLAAVFHSHVTCSVVVCRCVSHSRRAARCARNRSPVEDARPVRPTWWKCTALSPIWYRSPLGPRVYAVNPSTCIHVLLVHPRGQRVALFPEIRRLKRQGCLASCVSQKLPYLLEPHRDHPPPNLVCKKIETRSVRH